MRTAKEYASKTVDVELLSAQYPEDRTIVPVDFKATKDLTRSVQDLGSFSKKIKLPILADILQRLYDESDAEYLIYTNVDIGLYPDFYLRVNEFIDEGLDAFIINRRRLKADYRSLEDIPKLILDKGKKHPGFDCFVFHRDLFPHFELKEVCIGVPFIGITFAQNLFALSTNFKLYEREILTFHIGMEIFKGRAAKDYFRYNQKQFWGAMNSPLREKMSSRKLPYNNLWLPFRLIRWGLQPSIPIRLGLRLEKERFLGYFRKNK
jgi:hypothetical protein